MIPYLNKAVGLVLQFPGLIGGQDWVLYSVIIGAKKIASQLWQDSRKGPRACRALAWDTNQAGVRTDFTS